MNMIGQWGAPNPERYSPPPEPIIRIDAAHGPWPGHVDQILKLDGVVLKSRFDGAGNVISENFAWGQWKSSTL